VVGRDGLVVAIELDAATLAFARENLDRAGYSDVILVHGDGGLGHAEQAAYDRVCVTAACPNIPPPLIEQLAARGRLVPPSRTAPASCSPWSKRLRPAYGARS
jgi:protein-L-isoaspartate(D-aspartate) O-methyltransferase